MAGEETTSLIGSTVGNYSVISQLGAGAMGEVYLGEHPQIGRRVAIKVLVASFSANPQMAERFISEARAVNKIHHPNIIQIFDFGTLPDGRLYYTMEYLEGRELSHILRENAPLSVEETGELLRQIAGALDMAHGAGIIHRDLKPENIFVIPSPTGPIVKVLDFGIAKLLEGDMGSAHRTSTGMIMGTPLYMSPEQAAGEVHRISARSDIYALGVIVYQMLSGQLPIQAPTTAQILAKHITDPPTPLGDVAQGLPEEVAQVVECTLDKEPERRPPGAGQFYSAFQQAMSGTAPGFVPVATGDPPPMEAGAGDSRPTTLRSSASQALPGDDYPEMVRSRVPLIAGVLVGLAVVAVVVILVVKPFSASKTDEGGPKKEAMAAIMTPPMEPPVMMAAPPPMAQLEIFTVTVSSRTRGASVDVSVAGQTSFTRKPPFKLEAKKGERVVLKAHRVGYYEHTETFLVTADRKVAFKLERRRRGYRPMVRRPPSRPMARITRVRPRPRPRYRPRRRAMTAAGEGTLKPMFE